MGASEKQLNSGHAGEQRSRRGPRPKAFDEFLFPALIVSSSSWTSPSAPRRLKTMPRDRTPALAGMTPFPRRSRERTQEPRAGAAAQLG
jgi:hypothetical protein